MYVLANMWFQNIMRTFFFSVDKIVFGFISTIYDLLITIARTSVLSQADILDMADRVYKLLAVFMVFKVTFSLIMYVVNPDDFSDKSKGVSKLGMNIVFSLAMLILTPYIFNYAYQLQTIILEDNSLAALVFGDDIDSSAESPFNTAGDTMAFITLSPFFTPNLGIVNSECTTLIKNDKSFNEKCSGIEFDGTKFGAPTSSNKTLYFYTKTENGDNPHFNESDLKNYIVGVSNGSLGMMFRLDMAVATDAGNANFIMEYRYIFSTIVGAVVVLLLITFCMDVALRSIKLAFLQLIAPIPILSYVDPKSGKDGMFKKWYQMCFKTYLSLFLRLLALYFAVYIISRVDRMVDIVDGSYQTNMLVKIFIIIGALMFAKSFTKILEGLGLKLDGGFTLNPLKKMENEMLGGKTASKVAKTAGKYGGRLAKGLGMAGLVGTASAVTGHGFRGLGKSFMSSMRGEKFGKNFTSSYAAARARDKEIEEMKANGVKPQDVRKEKIRNFFGGMTRAEKVKQVEDKAKAVQSYYDNIKSQAIACDKNDNSYIKDANGNRIQTKSAKTLSKELDEMKKTQIDRSSFKDIDGKTAQQKFDDDYNSFNSKITQLNARKDEAKAKNSQINLEISKLKSEQFNLQRSNFSTDRDFYEANASYTQRLAVLEEQKQTYDISTIDNEISAVTTQRDSLDITAYSDTAAITAEQQYDEAITKQKEAIKAKEAELEARYNDLANGRVYYIDADGNEQTGTGTASADKVISESKEAMITLAKSVNSIGNEIDEDFEDMYVPTKEQIDTNDIDVVTMMKTSKGAVAQTTSGKMSDIKDVAKYAERKK